MIVSVVVPATIWDERLRRTLDTVRTQRLPVGVDVEVLVASPEGPPPGWARVVGEVWVENPTGAIPAGLNRAVARATGEVVVRVDSRCSLPTGYVAAMVRRLEDSEVGMVGGAALVMDPGWWGDLYGTVFNSPLLGPSRYRYSRRSGPAPTAYLGAWRRQDLMAWGRFDERLLRNQDNEIASRVAERGLVVWYEADAVVGYEAAKGPIAAARHHYGFGRWRMRQRAMGQTSMSTPQRLVVAGALVGATLGVLGMSARSTRRGALTLAGASYGAAAVLARLSAVRLRASRADLGLSPPSPVATALAPCAGACLDAAWALGLLIGHLRSRGGGAEVAR